MGDRDSLFKYNINSGIRYAVYIVISLIAYSGTVHGQNRDIEEMWMRQRDSSELSFNQRNYLYITDDEMLEIFDAQPSFGLFHDNYFITGIPTNKEINDQTADAKFQISIKQRLTKSILPGKTTLLLTYTQKSFWDIYQNSSPFAESNYNPGLTLVRPILHDHQLKGAAVLTFEHESNGLDSISSRSWNYFTLSGIYFYNANISIQAKLWAGILGDENKDLNQYRGHGLLAFNFRNNRDNIWTSLVVNPTAKLNRINTIFEFNYKPSLKANQYLFLQWYNGYGENLIDYNRYTSMIRIGVGIKPPMRNFY
ncbi:phospholipase A [Membranihabitans marinus]|uniref:phospholipase A n=1 Tax=Membranihabitans marinus TaxID=1227546 RepID=UPI001F3743DC|nr:phospholipase A [Membranihabitans marinus]